MGPETYFSYVPGVAEATAGIAKARKHEWQSHENRAAATKSVLHWRARGLDAQLYKLASNRRMLKVNV